MVSLIFIYVILLLCDLFYFLCVWKKISIVQIVDPSFTFNLFIHLLVCDFSNGLWWTDCLNVLRLASFSLDLENDLTSIHFSSHFYGFEYLLKQNHLIVWNNICACISMKIMVPCCMSSCSTIGGQQRSSKFSAHWKKTGHLSWNTQNSLSFVRHC